jgi:hypothetical protein
VSKCMPHSPSGADQYDRGEGRIYCNSINRLPNINK